MEKYDRRKHVLVEKTAITEFKKAVKGEYKFSEVEKERILGMIDYYLE
jgi:hypothetical protein